MRRIIHTDLGAHIAAIYDDHGNLDSFIPVPRGPVQDESKFADDDDLETMRRIQAGARETS